MYTENQEKIISLQDSYTLLYGILCREIITRCGPMGDRAVREGTRRFGRDRGWKRRQIHLDHHVKINMQSLFSVASDLPTDPRFAREQQELNPQERVSHTLICPMADVWKEYGLMEIGRIYCEEFHNACYSEYAYGCTKVNLSKTQTQKGDAYCSFNVVLRPCDLPEELRPVCFAEYDPFYEEPDLSKIPTTDAKEGFRSLWIRLYFYLLQASIEYLGETGRQAIVSGLECLAKTTAGLLSQQAAARGTAIDSAFLEAHYPICLDTEKDELWNVYTENHARELVNDHFCLPLAELLGLQAALKNSPIPAGLGA